MGIGDRPLLGRLAHSEHRLLVDACETLIIYAATCLFGLEFHEERHGRPGGLIQFAEISLPKRLMICISYFSIVKPLELFSSPSRLEDVLGFS